MPSNTPVNPATVPSGGTPTHNQHDEADIGSGEHSPGQDDTDAQVRAVPVQPPSDAKPAAPKP